MLLLQAHYVYTCAVNQFREPVWKKKYNPSSLAHCAVVQVLGRAGGGRRPEQGHVLLEVVLTDAVFCLLEVRAECNCSRTCTKAASLGVFLNFNC